MQYTYNITVLLHLFDIYSIKPLLKTSYLKKIIIIKPNNKTLNLFIFNNSVLFVGIATYLFFLRKKPLVLEPSSSYIVSYGAHGLQKFKCGLRCAPFPIPLPL